jgi:hypothetical protein
MLSSSRSNSPRSNFSSPLKGRTTKPRSLSILPVSDALDFSQMDPGHSITPLGNKLSK